MSRTSNFDKRWQLFCIFNSTRKSFQSDAKKIGHLRPGIWRQRHVPAAVGMGSSSVRPDRLSLLLRAGMLLPWRLEANQGAVEVHPWHRVPLVRAEVHVVVDGGAAEAEMRSHWPGQPIQVEPLLLLWEERQCSRLILTWDVMTALLHFRQHKLKLAFSILCEKGTLTFTRYFESQWYLRSWNVYYVAWLTEFWQPEIWQSLTLISTR